MKVNPQGSKAKGGMLASGQEGVIVHTGIGQALRDSGTLMQTQAWAWADLPLPMAGTQNQSKSKVWKRCSHHDRRQRGCGRDLGAIVSNQVSKLNRRNRREQHGQGE